MLPVLLNLQFLKVYTFGVFLVLAFFWSAYLLWKNFLLTAYKEDEIFDGLFLSLAGGLLISRLAYVVFNFNQFGFNFLKFILINGYPGLSLYGFILGFIGSLYLYFSAKKANFLDVGDYFVPSFFIALAFGKLGSFFSGAEVVVIKKVTLGAYFPLFESIIFFLATFLSYKILFAIRRNVYEKGFNLASFGWVFSLVYIVSYPFKTGKSVLNPSPNVILSFFLVLTFSLYFLYYFRNLIAARWATFRKNLRKNRGKKTK